MSQQKMSKTNSRTKLEPLEKSQKTKKQVNTFNPEKRQEKLLSMV